MGLDDDIETTGPGGATPAGTGGGANVGGGGGALAGPGAGGMSSSDGGAGGAMMGAGGMGTGGMGAGGMGAGGMGTGGMGGSGCMPTDVLVDGNLEGGPMGGSWTEASSNFMTPICDAGDCGVGGGSGPNAGTYWAWFGGANFLAPVLPEIGTLSQTVMIPAGGDAELEFMLEIPVCDSFVDTLTVSMDAQMIFFRDGADNDCGVLGYKKHTIDVTAYADGNNHTVEFEGINEALFLGPTNFFVDDITLIACQ